MNNLSLVSFLNNYVKVKDYFDIVDQLLDSVERMQREDMKIVLDLSTMSLKDGRLQFSIEREDSVYELSKIKDFLKELTFACVFSAQEQCGSVTQFLRLIDTVSEVNFYAVVRQYCEEQLGSGNQVQAAPARQQAPGDSQQLYYQGSADGETGVLSDSFWKNLESQYQSQPQAQTNRQADRPQTMQQQAVQQQAARPQPVQQQFTGQQEDYQAYSANGETGVLDPSFWQKISQGMPSQQGGYAQQRSLMGSLVDVKTGNAYVINKENFWIVKGDVDLRIDKDTVSRKHAQIIVKQNHFFIVDNDSTNKTYVDGKEIPPKASIELYNGTKIKFANEEYVFQI